MEGLGDDGPRCGARLLQDCKMLLHQKGQSVPPSGEKLAGKPGHANFFLLRAWNRTLSLAQATETLQQRLRVDPDPGAQPGIRGSDPSVANRTEPGAGEAGGGVILGVTTPAANRKPSWWPRPPH